METADTGYLFTRLKRADPRASHNFNSSPRVCLADERQDLSVDDKMLNYTLVQPVGVALVSPWNVPFMTATRKVARRAGAGQHRGAPKCPSCRR
ncbi:aldehyde dehydrogenase family protein [Salmonella enterica subsp. enterica]|nr:aldehyde dehydrogenase family protein [Salmonella enterica subsp. enterica]